MGAGRLRECDQREKTRRRVDAERHCLLVFFFVSPIATDFRESLSLQVALLYVLSSTRANLKDA